jgi:aminoglycoside phosphotransferase family enzyme/predicted kinase
MGQAINPQDAVFKFLGDPKTHGGREVRRIDTHAAAVFLAGDRAYKVKRAVHFPFLDYSTLAKRKEACLAELDANRRFASVLYRRVVPITRNASGQLALDGEGEPVEWAVEMLRFDEEQTLDCIAERKGIDDLLADKLATTVAAMHQSAPGAPTIPWLDAVEGYLDQNKAAFSEYLQLFPREELEKLDHAARSALRRLRPLLLTRGQLGLVRRGHGDLHLGNVALVDGRPIPFDAIEFDPMVATGDVLYDLAFLLMDIVERRLDRAANIVFNRYFSETHRIEDIDGLAALPFFLSLRAAIRAKVTAARLQSTDAQGQGAILQSAQAYFQLALNLLSPPLPKLVAVGGLSGTGKSVLARALAPSLAPAPGALILRSDVERKKLFDAQETERLPPEAYRPNVSVRIYQALFGMAARAIEAGHSAVVDAVFDVAEERATIEKIASKAGVQFQGLFLTADLRTRLARIGGRIGDASDADAAVAAKQESLALGPIEWTQIDASGPLEETLAQARAAIG